MVGLFSPDSKAGKFFWPQMAVVVCSLLFLIAAVIVIFVNEERGKAPARLYAGE